MATNVFANGREISAKASTNKSIAAMPDVCLSPPSPPAGPIPIPYPNFSKASDTSSGTKKVKIGGKEVGLKNSSNYKKSKGDEPATRGLGMNVITHTIQGKTKFAAWSFDVKFEGKNVTRLLDLTTHNHMNPPGGGVTSSAAKGGAGTKDAECETLDQKNKDERKKLKSKTEDKTLVGPKKKGKGTTVSSASFTPAGKRKARWTQSAHNNHKAHEKCPDSLVAGGDMDDRREGTSNLCKKAKFEHASPCDQKSGHAEARLLDELFKSEAEGGAGRAGGRREGKLTVNIDWRPKTGPKSKMPCPDCHKMLCAAQECGLEIYLCDKKGKKQKMTDEHCPAEPATYEALKETMGEA